MHLFVIHAQILHAPFFYRFYFYEKANVTLFMLHVSDIRQLYIYICDNTILNIYIIYYIMYILYIFRIVLSQFL